MSLEELIARRSGVEMESVGVAPPVPGAGESDSSPTPRPASEPDEKGEQEPWGVAESVTPSGLSLYYQAGPERLYTVNGKEVPSVTTVLDVLERGGLSWWGMKIGVQSLLTLMERGLVRWVD